MKKIIAGIILNLFILVATYLITILALFMFKSVEPLNTRILDTIAITTITYCFGIIAHNVLEKKGTLITILGTVLLVVYMIIYVSVKNSLMHEIYFKIMSYALIGLVMINDIARIVVSHTNLDDQRIIKALSA